jgi:hypothetical protein
MRFMSFNLFTFPSTIRTSVAKDCQSQHNSVCLTWESPFYAHIRRPGCRYFLERVRGTSCSLRPNFSSGVFAFISLLKQRKSYIEYSSFGAVYQHRHAGRSGAGSGTSDCAGTGSDVCARLWQNKRGRWVFADHSGDTFRHRFDDETLDLIPSLP